MSCHQRTTVIASFVHCQHHCLCSDGNVQPETCALVARARCLWQRMGVQQAGSAKRCGAAADRAAWGDQAVSAAFWIARSSDSARRRCLCTDGCSGAWVGSVAGNAKRVALAQVKQPGGGRTTRLAIGCTLRWPDGCAGLPPDWRAGGGKADAQGRYLHMPPSKIGALGAVNTNTRVQSIGPICVRRVCGHRRGARQAHMDFHVPPTLCQPSYGKERWEGWHRVCLRRRRDAGARGLGRPGLGQPARAPGPCGGGGDTGRARVDQRRRRAQRHAGRVGRGRARPRGVCSGRAG